PNGATRRSRRADRAPLTGVSRSASRSILAFSLGDLLARALAASRHSPARRPARPVFPRLAFARKRAIVLYITQSVSGTKNHNGGLLTAPRELRSTGSGRNTARGVQAASGLSCRGRHGSG